MSELDNLPKIEIKADLTKVTENAYNDTLKEPLKSSSKITSTVLNFFYNTVLYPMQKYNLYAEDKLKKYAEDLQNRAKKIPEKNLVNPRVNILGPTVEGLKYNLDEEYIKEMFTNILLSDMDNRKQSKVLPSYIEIIKQLSKEDAEHIMLVDLARNDLSRGAGQVKIEFLRQIQYYSHVIHMVSRVSACVSENTDVLRLFADTFPAGTLSGAPKVRAMQLIDDIEPHSRGIYGGCIGYIGFQGELNQAITIRSFLSYGNRLYAQAGAGIVAHSSPESELQELNNKLGALMKAVEMSEKVKN